MTTTINYKNFEAFDAAQYLPRKQYSIVNTEKNKVAEKVLSQDEKKKFDQFVATLQGDFPEDVKDTASVIRFLRARQFNLGEAEKLYRKRMDWIKTYKPHMITDKDVKKQIDMGKIFWYGFDSEGRPIMVVRAGNHFPKGQTEEELYRFLVYILELGYAIASSLNTPSDKVIIIYDRANFNLKNFDISLFTKFNSLADYYPETVYKFQILGANYLFQVLFKVVKKVLDPVTAAKIHVLPTDGKKAREELAQSIPKECLLPDHGGQVKYKMHIPYATPEAFAYNPAGQGQTVTEEVTDEQKHQIEKEVEQQYHISVDELELD